MPWGIVSGVYGARCEVLHGEREIPCLLRGKFKQEGSACPVVVGDDVEYRMVDARQGVIERVRERRSELRRYGGERQRRARRGNQVMLANADQAVFVAAAREPGIDFMLVDRALATARACGLAPALCVNKIDLADEEDMRRLMAPYERMGMPVVYASAARGEGLEELRRLLAGKVSLFWGGSGVGKSSLIRALTGRDIRVGVWNKENPRGPHTTANAHLYPLPDGGILADTPGFDMLLLSADIEAAPVEEVLLPEAAPLAPACRFPNCTHRGEAGCAVQQAVLSGGMDAGRYARFLTLVGPAAIDADPESPPSEVVSVGGELFRRLTDDDREQFIETWNGLGKTAWCYYWPFVRGYGIEGEREIVWREIENALCVFVRLTGRGQEQVHMLFPPLGADMGTAMHESVRLLRRVNASGRAKVMWVDEEDAHALRSLRSVRLRTKNDEYWYRPAELLAMEGPRFARLRRELRHLQKQHAVGARPYQIEDLEACLAILRRWNETQGRRYPAVLDTAYADTTLRRFEEFSWEDLTGVVAEVDGAVRGFAFGGRLSGQLGHAFLLKADLEIPNLSAYTFIELLRVMSDYEWVNSGGDLRQTGLARWKERLRPGKQPAVFQAIVR